MGVELVQGVRGEERIETGEGYIVGFDDKPDKRNNQLEIRATHANLTQPVKGWVDRQGPLFAVVTQAHAQGTPVMYRIAVRRKANVDEARPVAELKNTEKVRELDHLELRPPGGANAPTAAPANPPAAAAPAPAAPSRPAPAPNTPPPPPAPSEAPGANAGDGGDPGPTEPGGAPASRTPGDGPDNPRREFRGRLQEGKPWEPYNSDGSVNLGSYAVTASLGFVEWAHRLLTHHHLDQAKHTGRPFTPPAAPEVRELARRLLRAADLTQAALRSDGKVDRMDNSHTRARGAIREAIDAVPLPWGSWQGATWMRTDDELSDDDREARDHLDAWVKALAARAAGLLTLALQLLDPEALEAK